MRLDEALKKLLFISNEVKNYKSIPIWQGLGCVSAKDVACKKNLPSFNNSAMDGYAFKFEQKDNPLHVRGSILAGDNPKECLHVNECYKIMTGAKVPNDVDTIVEIEKVTKDERGYINIPKNIKKHNALRFKGEETKKGELLIPKKTLLTPSSIMLLASQGIVNIDVYIKPKIVIISTGNELVEPWDEADEDSIYNTNTTGVMSILSSFGFEADYGGIVPDSLEKSVEFFASLKQNYDVIISSGGVSYGDADFVLKGLNENGFKEAFHGINMKPGRPILAGKLDEKLVIGLPGNPMATYLGAYIFVLPALKKISNFKKINHETFKAKNLTEFACKSGRSNIILGRYENGTFEVTNNNKNSSGMITPIFKSNAIVISDEKDDGYKTGDMLDIMRL